MKKNIVVIGFVFNFLNFSVGKKIYCNNISGKNIDTFARGFIYSKLINIQEVYLYPMLKKSNELEKKFKKQAQYFDYNLSKKEIDSYTQCKWCLNISIDLPNFMKGKQYKLGYHVFIHNTNKEESLWISLKDFIIEDTYLPEKKEEETILFKDLIFLLPFKKIEGFLKNISGDSVQVQLILVPYLVNQPNCIGKIYTQCKNQYAVDDEENEMPYLSFK